MNTSLAELPLFAHPAPAETDQAAKLAREAMVRLYRKRAALASQDRFSAQISAVDLGEWLDAYGWAQDRRWSVVVFRAPKGLWRINGTRNNPRRHDAITVTYELNEDRAKELGM